ncbi:NAD-dependent epimerase/dehydratase family protein [Pseudomonas gingeri]|uniref:NAD-dependent epimerase/dehydratase family protein n=1 Tax=Pseudomonas gingeri TaxID=117681 RepID=UPI0015A2C89E|nr:NAD-dependent epimerase/dehydratase family protein [Pseudomonas gingeri]NWE45777.1 NAD-dependent epimerase/dehydratase family protein [Pseudomonas gingeri]
MSARHTTGKSTLVIGGGGYIGAYLVPQLLATGRQVTVLGRSVKPRFELPEQATYVCGDFGQQTLIGSLLDAHQEVIHLAYATVPNTSFENPLADLLQNLPPTVQLFTEAAKRSIKLVLISSGGTVYGEALPVPIAEMHPTKPISPYGVTKLTLENYAYLYAKTHGLKFVCARPANAYGRGQRPFIGQGFISTAIASSINGLPIRVFGETGAIRDYLYVSDLASGIVCCLEYGKLSECYNLGSSVGSTNLDIINNIRPLMLELGCTVRVENLPERVFDVKSNILDSSKLTRDTGWSASTSLLDGLVATRDWLWSSRSEF